jgi:hypothetical protein
LAQQGKKTLLSVTNFKKALSGNIKHQHPGYVLGTPV